MLENCEYKYLLNSRVLRAADVEEEAVEFFLSAGAYAHYSVATKTAVTNGAGSSLHSLDVHEERGGGDNSYFRKAIDF